MRIRWGIISAWLAECAVQPTIDAKEKLESPLRSGLKLLSLLARRLVATIGRALFGAWRSGLPAVLWGEYWRALRPISLSTVLNRDLRHPSRHDPHLIRVYPRFIGVHQRPWIFVEIFRLAKLKRERGPMSREERHYFDPCQGAALHEVIEEINETSIVQTSMP